jgi:hypothetical protein
MNLVRDFSPMSLRIESKDDLEMLRAMARRSMQFEQERNRGWMGNKTTLSPQYYDAERFLEMLK